MDEMDHQEQADRQEKTCYVLSEHACAEIAFPVPRCGKRIPLVACIAADGSFPKPVVVIPGKTFDTEIPLTGITSEKVQIHSQRMTCINRSIFWS
jgi:hypothetical protein